MNKPIRYLFSVLTAVLLVFCCLGAGLSAMIRLKALNIDTFQNVVQEELLPAKAHNELLAYFQEQENVTGIPADTYAPAIAEDKLRVIITEKVQNAFDYFDGKADAIGTAPDFSVLETQLSDFFSKFADENGCEKDAKYDETLAKAIDSAKTKIESACDVFRFSMLNDAGLPAKVRKAMPLIKYALIGSLCGIAVLLIVLLILCREKKSRVLYWFGSAVLAASVLLLIPAVWLQATRWFDRFAVKSDQIFAAVTGYLYTMTGTAITCSVIGIFVALCLYLLAGVTGRAGRRR